MPKLLSCSAGPIPESISNWGEATAPLQTMISSASTVNFSPPLSASTPHRPFAFEQDPVGCYVTPDREVEPVASRIQVVESVAHAHTVDSVAGPGRDTRGIRMVLVFVDGVAFGHTGLFEGHGMRQPIAARVAAHRHRSVGAVKVTTAKVQVGLHPIEVG